MKALYPAQPSPAHCAPEPVRAGLGSRTPEALRGGYEVTGREKELRAARGLLHMEVKRFPARKGMRRDLRIWVHIG